MTTERWLAYGRFSTDLQNDKSNVDQLRECRTFLERFAPGATIVREFGDAGLSGSSMIRRRDLQALLRAARAREADAVITESLDRLSRSQADIATIFEGLRYAGLRLVTVAEGDIDEWKLGILGAKNAVYLKDLAIKTRRGLHGRAAAGRSAGGLSYGYSLDRSLAVRDKRTGQLVTERGVLKIDPDQARIVERIHRLYAVRDVTEGNREAAELRGHSRPARASVAGEHDPRQRDDGRRHPEQRAVTSAGLSTAGASTG